MKTILLLLSLLLFQSATQAASTGEKSQVTPKAEPAFWWSGMKNPFLQLMMHSPDIARCKASISDTRIKLKSTASLGNPNYLFLDLDIGQAPPGVYEILFSDGKETKAKYSLELKQRESGAALRKGFDSSDALYLLMPDRFANANPGNDEVAGMKEKPDRNNKGGRHGGDIQGIRNHLDYIANMGFTAIWLNPVLENDQPSYSYHGYSTTDFYKVDPRYGTNEEYKALASDLKGKGMKLIMDLIFNHCGSEHWWMKDLPSTDWINEHPDYRITNHEHLQNVDPYASSYDKTLFTDGWFVPTMPDLNQRNPYLATYLIQNSIWWIEYLGLAGIRQDTYAYPDKEMMANWNRRISEEYPHFNIVGEEWHINPGVVSYWQKDKMNNDGYRGQLPSLMDFPLQNAVSQGLREQGAGGLFKLYECLANDFQYPNPGNLVIFPDNHDMDRFYVQMGQDFDLFKMGIAFYLTTRGIPQIFYGTEVLLSHNGSDHGDIRKDFPGGWQGDQTNGFTGMGLSSKEKEAAAHISKLLNWRKGKKVIHTGQLRHFLPFDGLYVYFRYNASEKVMVVLNKNSTEKRLDTSRLSEMTASCKRAKEVISGREYDDPGQIIIPPRSAAIFELK